MAHQVLRPGFWLEELALDAGCSIDGIAGMLRRLDAPCRTAVWGSNIPGYKKVAAADAVDSLQRIPLKAGNLALDLL